METSGRVDGGPSRTKLPKSGAKGKAKQSTTGTSGKRTREVGEHGESADEKSAPKRKKEGTDDRQAVVKVPVPTKKGKGRARGRSEVDAPADDESDGSGEEYVTKTVGRKRAPKETVIGWTYMTIPIVKTLGGELESVIVHVKGPVNESLTATKKFEIVGGELADEVDGLDVVAVDVGDGHLWTRRCGRGGERSERTRVGDGADLVVDTEVDGVSGAVDGEAVEAQGLVDNALASEGGVTVEETYGGVVLLLVILDVLDGAGLADDDGVVSLEMGGVGDQGETNLLARERWLNEIDIEMVLDVSERVRSRPGWRLKLLENRLENSFDGFSDDVGQRSLRGLQTGDESLASLRPEHFSLGYFEAMNFLNDSDQMRRSRIMRFSSSGCRRAGSQQGRLKSCELSRKELLTADVHAEVDNVAKFYGLLSSGSEMREDSGTEGGFAVRVTVGQAIAAELGLVRLDVGEVGVGKSEWIEFGEMRATDLPSAITRGETKHDTQRRSKASRAHSPSQPNTGRPLPTTMTIEYKQSRSKASRKIRGTTERSSFVGLVIISRAKKMRWYCPEMGALCRLLVLSSFIQRTKTTRCHSHASTDKASENNDTVPKEGGYRVTGVALPSATRIVAPKPLCEGEKYDEYMKGYSGKFAVRPDPENIPTTIGGMTEDDLLSFFPLGSDNRRYTHCGCELDVAIMDFFMWKTAPFLVSSLPGGSVECIGSPFDTRLRPTLIGLMSCMGIRPDNLDEFFKYNKLGERNDLSNAPQFLKDFWVSVEARKKDSYDPSPDRGISIDFTAPRPKPYVEVNSPKSKSSRRPNQKEEVSVELQSQSPKSKSFGRLNQEEEDSDEVEGSMEPVATIGKPPVSAEMDVIDVEGGKEIQSPSGKMDVVEEGEDAVEKGDEEAKAQGLLPGKMDVVEEGEDAVDQGNEGTKVQGPLPDAMDVAEEEEDVAEQGKERLGSGSSSTKKVAVQPGGGVSSDDSSSLTSIEST
ncbi:hypothetical protein NMY22_g5394 [Coprinellus aureogranulatus]|nr:hypothetical protein NMY22_g5394 [Coprinellus aureogranulatus]